MKISIYNCFQKKCRQPFLSSLMVLVVIGTCLHVNAQGDLLITPKRIVFEGNKKADNLNLANIGKDSATYVISFDHVKMKEDGTIERITEPEPGINFADKNLRIFPRTVTLGPKEVQSVKLQVYNTQGLQPGEYRTNLYFRAITNPKPLGDAQPKNDSTVSIRIVPTFGISIPAIIRIGEPDVAVNISDAQFGVEQDTIPFVKFNFNRSGNMSVYGDVVVDHISPICKTNRVGVVNGVAVNTPNAKRIFKVRLDRRAGADLGTGRLKVSYLDANRETNVLAQQEISLKG